MVLIGILSTVGGVYILGSIARQNLISTTEGVANLLQRGRSEAASRSDTWVGVKFTNSEAFSFIDSDEDGIFDSGEIKLMTYTFKDNVRIVNGCGNNAIDASARPYIYFDGQGFCGTLASLGNFTEKEWQVFLYNSRVETAQQAREVEALVNGLIEVIKPGQSGNVSTNPMQANKSGSLCASP